MSAKTGLKNLLAREKSPYLLQHADNPVDWRPWGPEALAEAKRRDVPLFVSVGYAACHWCHVMAHESFEDPETAALVNAAFVCVKVDREERPDVDHLCMAACQALTGSGGWPLNAFLTPDGRPFFAGTYFPKKAVQGMPGFTDVAAAVSRLWREDRQRLLSTAAQLVNALAPPAPQGRDAGPDPGDIDRARALLGRAYDPVHGGFGLAPKFPSPHNLMFLTLLARSGRDPGGELAEMVQRTLASMRRGGVYDQLGFGIHRYSVDERWMVPHFEKMLYDQALVAIACMDAYGLAKDPDLLAMAREILAYSMRDLARAHGGFATAEDADTEGVEGETYVWTPAQVREALDPELAGLAMRFFGVTEEGTFEKGKSVLSLPAPLARQAARLGLPPEELAEKMEAARIRLLEKRGERPRPLLDDKVLTGQNGLIIAALARGYAALGDESFLSAARKAVSFVFTRLSTPEGGLLRRYREGEAAIPGFLDDYACFIWGLLTLFQAAHDPEDLAAALRLADMALARFADPETGGLRSSGADNEALAVPFTDLYDGAVPSAQSVMAHNLVALAAITGEARYAEKARALAAGAARSISRNPTGHTHLLAALFLLDNPPREAVVTGDPGRGETRALLRVLAEAAGPGVVGIHVPPGEKGARLAALAPRLAAYRDQQDPPRAFVCRDRTCLPAVCGPGELAAALGGETL